MPKKPSQKSVEVKPEAKLEGKSRRRHSLEYKMRTIAEADACQRGELSELLRRESLCESLYSSQI